MGLPLFGKEGSLTPVFIILGSESSVALNGNQAANHTRTGSLETKHI